MKRIDMESMLVMPGKTARGGRWMHACGRVSQAVSVLIAVSAFLFPAGAVAAPADPLWKSGNEAYISGDYSGAITAYEKIAAEYESPKLYYNLANAYFKDGQLGSAILFYNRALSLDPNDRDTRWNLEIAESRVRVKIEPVPRFFVVRWFDGFKRSMSADGWSVLALAALGVALGATLLYLLTRRSVLRKAGFYCAVCGIVIFVAALSFALSKPAGEAIVMSAAATVKTSPDGAAKDAFILYEGTKVRVVGALGMWSEVEVADGNKGWVSSAAIESIR